MLVVHLHVDTRDAMGANLVNSMCEGVASLIETITDGKVFLRIVSNLADRALAKASVTLTPDQLAGRGYSGEEVRDGIIIASDFALADPYRAATHNKGIMNGIDAVALATGNDWRAIEAGAHAWAARGEGHYTALSRWWQDDAGNLCGELQLPLKVGIVGGPLESNPSVAVNLRLLGVESATELAEVMAAAGLAQNFAALRVLATDGIQTGHMTLHARTVVKAAGTPVQHFEKVLERLLRSGEIKVWRAKEILDELLASAPGESSKLLKKSDAELGSGYGKIILLGEHSVVYGRHAIAFPIPLRMRALVEDIDKGVELIIPRWGVEYQLAKPPEQRRSFEKAAGTILDELGLADRGIRIEVFPDVPRGMGLGGSAALAVAIIRALDLHFKLGLNDDDVNRLAYQSEKIAHGQPSGIDNTLATFAQPLVFRKDSPPLVELLNIPQPIYLVVGMTHSQGLTAKTVGAVRAARERLPRVYDKIFDDIDALALQAVSAIQENRMDALGELMNINQGLLNALQVSTPELENLIHIARDAGALGAKLTGGGGGGAIVALCKDETRSDAVKEALEQSGYEAFAFTIGGPA
jgi:hydroxymethylglutaryl-CoA reductase